MTSKILSRNSLDLGALTSEAKQFPRLAIYFSLIVPSAHNNEVLISFGSFVVTLVLKRKSPNLALVIGLDSCFMKMKREIRRGVKQFEYLGKSDADKTIDISQRRLNPTATFVSLYNFL